MFSIMLLLVVLISVSRLAVGQTVNSAPATVIASPFQYASGVALDSAGNIYVSDYYYKTVSMLTPAGTYVRSFSAPSLSLYYHTSIAVDNHNNLLVLFDGGNARIIQFSINSAAIVNIFTGFTACSGISVDSGGNIIYVNNSILTKMSSIGSVVWSVSSHQGLVAVNSADQIYVMSVIFGPQTTMLALYGSDGTVVNNNITATAAYSTIFAVDSSNNLYFANSETAGEPYLTKTNSAGVRITDTYAASLGSATDIAIDSAGNLYISLQEHGGVVKYNSTSLTLITTFYGASPQLSAPTSMIMDAAGNFYVADTNNNRVVKLLPNGTLIGTVAVDAVGMNKPTGLLMNSAGDLFILDSGNSRILKAASSTLNVVIGTTSSGGTHASSAGNSGYSGATITTNTPTVTPSSSATHQNTNSASQSTLSIGFFHLILIAVFFSGLQILLF